jgi:site-specific DNA recombinase
MLAAAEEGLFGTLYIFDLSRLARESIINATTLKKLVYKYKVRIVSLTEGVDSNNQGWFTLATVLGLQHEQYLKTLGANVLRGLIGNLLDGLSVGDLAYGYGSVPVPGADERRHGRNKRTRKKYVIKEQEASSVKRVFHWFVKEEQPIQWIVRELNRLKAPRDKRSRGQKWGRAAVINMLRRTKYIGIWPWGEFQNQRDSETGEVYQEPRDEEEWKKWVRHLPELKIVDEEIFAKAQRRLDENEAKCAEFRDDDGTFKGSPKELRIPAIFSSGAFDVPNVAQFSTWPALAGNISPVLVLGDGVCKCRTMLPRKLAKERILNEIGRRILDDSAWRRAVHEAAMRAWDTFQSEVPGELQTTHEQIREIERRISNLIDQMEEGNAPPDVRDRFDARREEKERLLRHAGELERRTKQTPRPMMPEQIDEALEDLQVVLSSGTPAAAIALGNLIGDVDFCQVSRPGRKRPFLRGEFVLRARNVVNAINGTGGTESSNGPAGPDVAGEKIAIEFVEPDPKYEQSDLAKQLRDNGMANWEIAEQLGLCYSRVTFLWRFWYERRGLAAPKGCDRPKRKQRETPLYQQIADVATQKWEAGESESAIGRDFKTTQATVREAIAWWHGCRQLPVPRFKNRRQTQVERVGSMSEAGSTLAEIAQKMHRSTNTVRKMLGEFYTTNGEVRPDGRTQRHRLRVRT